MRHDLHDMCYVPRPMRHSFPSILLLFIKLHGHSSDHTWTWIIPPDHFSDHSWMCYSRSMFTPLRFYIYMQVLHRSYYCLLPHASTSLPCLHLVLHACCKSVSAAWCTHDACMHTNQWDPAACMLHMYLHGACMMRACTPINGANLDASLSPRCLALPSLLLLVCPGPSPSPSPTPSPSSPRPSPRPSGSPSPNPSPKSQDDRRKLAAGNRRLA